MTLSLFSFRSILALHPSLTRHNTFKFIQFSSSTTKLHSTNRDTETIMKKVLVPIAQDSEEIETACITDTLTRFGAHVVVASIQPHGNLVCKMSRGLKIMADISIEDAAKEEWDLIALPGGMPGATYLRDCKILIDLLKQQQNKGKFYGAICASPSVVLAHHHLVEEGATCYPADNLRNQMKHPRDTDVVVQGNVITSQGPGTSLIFALKLGELLYGKSHADKIAQALLVKYN